MPFVFLLAANQLVRFDDSDDDFDSASQVASSTQVRNSTCIFSSYS